MSVAQLKILQEVITLTVLVPFALLYMRQPLRLDFLWAALCIMAAVFLHVSLTRCFLSGRLSNSHS